MFNFGKLLPPARGYFLSIVLLASVALPIAGQTTDAPPAARPNFSGRWRMVKEKSQFNGFKVPDAVIRIVDQHDPLLNLHTIQTTGKNTAMSDVIYFTDNSVTTNTIRGRDAQCRAYWDGAALVVRTKMIMANGEHEVIEDRWELSADGKTLTTGSHIVTESGEANLTLVCEKEEDKKN
jgi:hypothetical protein